MKNKLLKTIFMLVLVFVTFSFSACGNVRSMVLTNADGTVDELVYAELDSKAVLEAGYDLQTFKNDVAEQALIRANLVADELNNSILSRLALADENTTEEEILDLRKAYKNFNIVGDTWSGDNFVIGLRFRDVSVYRTAYGMDNANEIKMKEEKHFFYSKVYQTGTTVYAGFSALYDNVIEYFTEKYPNLMLENDGELLYTIASDLRREHSDADYITKSDGKYYHTWIVDKDNLNREITIYYNVANKANCILVCLGITFVVCGILFLISFIINKKHKKIENKAKKLIKN